jgi:SdiA-regulated
MRSSSFEEKVYDAYITLHLLTYALYDCGYFAHIMALGICGISHFGKLYSRFACGCHCFVSCSCYSGSESSQVKSKTLSDVMTEYMQKMFLALGTLFLLLFGSVQPAFAAVSLNLVNGTAIGGSLLAADAGFEVSGMVYHPGRGTYIVVSDEGQIAEISTSGLVRAQWNLGSSYDLEDVTLIDVAASVVYLADENTSSARAFDLNTGSLTGKSWSFASKIYETSDGLGLEGLTYVPDGQHPFGTTVSGGVFYAGWQEDGDIYVFEPNLSTGATTYREELHMEAGVTDLSALSYDRVSRTLYLAYDGSDRLEQRSASGTLLATQALPGSNQEALSVFSACPGAVPTVAIGEDGGGITLYSSSSTCTSPQRVQRGSRR